MECFMKANKVSNYNMRMLRENIRIPFTLIVVVLYVMESLFAVLAFSRSVHIDVTPFAFVFIVNQENICQGRFHHKDEIPPITRNCLCAFYTEAFFPNKTNNQGIK